VHKVFTVRYFEAKFVLKFVILVKWSGTQIHNAFFPARPGCCKETSGIVTNG
jgi:hypothetical protein